ncbi:MAG: histidine phosphatase family protein [Phycisphaerales bacterium]|nr:histidine phosphatase family protein [Phycisphaerales bacterium]
MAEKRAEIQLVLCRAGRTQWDLEDRLQGDSDMPLAEAGRHEVEDAVASFADAAIGVVYAPEDTGAQETAKIIAAHAECKLKTSAKLAEVDLGLWEGSLETDVCDRFTKAYRLWRDDPSAVTPAEGEPIEDAQRRLITAVAKIVDKAGKSTPAVVLRPVVLGLLKCRLTGEPTSKLWSLVEAQPVIEVVTVRPGDLDLAPEKVKAL